MSIGSRPQDRRQFGRRTVCLHGWILVDGRPRLPCIVRNLSVEGALLELDAPTWLPYYFRLVIDVSQFESECEIRHQTDRSLGVRFVSRRSDAPAPRISVDDITSWTARGTSN